MNEARAHFRSNLAELPRLRELLTGLCREAWGVDDEDDPLARFTLATHEAASNIIQHAYAGTEGAIDVEAGADSHSAWITLTHTGSGFDPETVRPPDFDGSRERGFGLYMIRQAVSDVQYYRDDQGRHVIRLTQRREQGEPCS